MKTFSSKGISLPQEMKEDVPKKKATFGGRAVPTKLLSLMNEKDLKNSHSGEGMP